MTELEVRRKQVAACKNHIDFLEWRLRMLRWLCLCIIALVVTMLYAFAHIGYYICIYMPAGVWCAFESVGR